MLKNFYRVITVTATLTIFTVTAMLPAFAGTTGRKNTAIALTAATAYSVLKKKDRQALVLGIGSAQAWKNYEDSRKRDSRHKYARLKWCKKHHRYHAYGSRNHYRR